MRTLRQILLRATVRARYAVRERPIVAISGIPGLLRHPVWRVADADQGRGRGVLLVPGFGFGDSSLALTRTWLGARGYRPASAGVGINIGCTTDLVGLIEERLGRHAAATGGRVVLVGQSRGGVLARLVAVRHPDLVAGVVMLGSPVLDPLGVHPRVIRIVRLLTRLSAAGVPNLLAQDCLSGACFEASTAGLLAPLDRSVPALAVYSRIDRIVPWRACLDRYAECVEIRSSHVGMGLSPSYFLALQRWLTTRISAPEIPEPGEFSSRCG